MTSAAEPLDGCVALVTGASGGIGREIAIALAQAGADVGLVARGRDGLEETAVLVKEQGANAAVATCDITDERQVAGAVADLAGQLGDANIVVNNAGGARFVADLESMGIEGWDKTVNLNLRAPLVFAKAALPGLQRRGGGSVITIGSVVGDQALTGLAHYSTAKSALVMLNRNLAREWGRYGIRCNLLVPGLVDSGVHEHFEDDESMAVLYRREIPLARWGEPREIAAPVVFLASAAASYITGATLLVDGGIVA